MWAIPRAKLRVTGHASLIALTVVLFGWAALSVEPFFQGAPFQSIISA